MVNEALAVVSEELGVLRETINATRGVIESAKYAALETEYAAEIGNGPVPPVHPTKFPYPPGITLEQLYDDKPVKRSPPPDLGVEARAVWEAEETVRHNRAVKDYWLSPAKLVKWNDTRWNGKRHAIRRASRKLVVVKRFLLDRQNQGDHQGLLNRFTEAMRTISSLVTVFQSYVLFRPLGVRWQCAHSLRSDIGDGSRL